MQKRSKELEEEAGSRPKRWRTDGGAVDISEEVTAGHLLYSQGPQDLLICGISGRKTGQEDGKGSQPLPRESKFPSTDKETELWLA